MTTDYEGLVEQLATPGTARIVMLVMDGLGGLPLPDGRPTELEQAATPHLDALAARSALGLADIIAPGITPGSGPGHLALFGYDPVDHNIGRGVLAAYGIDFPIAPGDVAIRGNFATLAPDGTVGDRRAGRLPTARNEAVCAALNEQVRLPSPYQVFFRPESEHRVLVVLRGPGLGAAVNDTDPQKVGLRPLEPQGCDPAGSRTAELVCDLTRQIAAVLQSQPDVDTILMRGFAAPPQIAAFGERFRMRPLAVTQYPMYRGLAKMVGMQVSRPYNDFADGLDLMRQSWQDHDFFFFHVKKTDSYGEDGNYDAKVKMIEQVDRMIPDLLALAPEVLVVTGDHSTPAQMRGHSWHPVPVLLASALVRHTGIPAFHERQCLTGSLGHFAMKHLMPLALAHAGRLKKFGA